LTSVRVLKNAVNNGGQIHLRKVCFLSRQPRPPHRPTKWIAGILIDREIFKSGIQFIKAFDENEKTGFFLKNLWKNLENEKNKEAEYYRYYSEVADLLCIDKKFYDDVSALKDKIKEKLIEYNLRPS